MWGRALPLLWLTACVLSPPAAGMLCTFEESDPCAWKWKDTLRLVTGRQAENMVKSKPLGMMSATRVDADNNTDGHYLLMTSRRNKTKAQLWSPWFKESGEGCRIEMDICSHTRSRTKISIVISKEHGDPVYVSGRPRHTFGEWNKFTEKIGKRREPFHLMIEMTDHGGNIANHIGIDNILLKDCLREPQPTLQPCSTFKCINDKCLSLDDVCNIKRDCHEGEDESELLGCGKTPPGTPCDFESGQCGWKRGQGELEWKYRSGHESLDELAPSFDNTLGNKSGHFMLMEFTGGDFSAFGELVSPLFPPMPPYHGDPHSPYYQSCKLRFFIHMYGVNMGAAYVNIIDAHGREEIWRRYGNQGSSDWLPQVVVLPPSFNESYHLTFTVAKSFSSKVSIGLDDVSLSRECFAIGVPEKYHHEYHRKYNLSDPGTWTTSLALPEPNGTVFSFDTCGAIGHEGPQQRECNKAYENHTGYHVTVLDVPRYKGVQRWRVPTTGIYS